MIFVAFLMILPFWLIISVSFSDSGALTLFGYRLVPAQVQPGPTSSCSGCRSQLLRSTA
jgi:ABC-type glycerol-3-phosphate transport system permease component